MDPGRAIRRPRPVLRHRALTFELPGDRLLLSPLPADPRNLFAVAGNGVYAGTATLTATLTAGGEPLAASTVAFTLNSGQRAGRRRISYDRRQRRGHFTGVALTGFDAGTCGRCRHG